MDQSLAIATIGEESFKLGTAVLLRSVITNTTSLGLEIFILDMNLQEETRKQLTATVQRLRSDVRVEFLKAQDSVFFRRLMELMSNEKQIYQCWFAKLAIPDLLPDRLKQFFYLDSDIYCNCDLAELPSMLGTQPACGVLDHAITGEGYSVEYEMEGLDPTAPFINGGLIGLDLIHWREHNLIEQALVLAERYKGMNPAQNRTLSPRAREMQARHGTHFSDQAVFNILFHNQWKILSSEWNVQSPFGFGLFSDISGGRKINLHYVTNPKPWQVPEHPTTKFFYKELDATAYKGWRPNALYQSIHFKLRTAKYKLDRLLKRLSTLRKAGSKGS